MSTTPLVPRSTLLAIFALSGALALSVGACGTSHNQTTGKPSTSATPATSPTTATPTPPPPPPLGNDHIEGLINSVSGNTIHLTQRDRSAATVDFTPQTMITELGPAKLPDVTTGSCVDVQAGPESTPPGGSITAQSVTISPAIGGKCPPPEGAAQGQGVSGTVSSVTGSTIDVSSTDPTGKTTSTNVTVTDTTTYTKHAVTNAQAIQQGKCMAAQGTNSGGALQATTIDLEPCPPMGRPHHHFHLPHHHH